MKRWLQNFGFRANAYDRPNQEWLCDRDGGTHPCPMGPDRRGACQATHECQPYCKDDRWHCNRPRKGSNEKACEPGPSPEGVCCRPIVPCSPRRSLRSLRGRVVLWTVALSLGVLALLLTSERGRVFMTPGDLSSAHSFSEESCQDCHAQGDNAPIHWLTDEKAAAAHSQSAKCLECHNLGSAPMNPHSLPDEALAELSEAAARTRMDAEARPPLRIAMSAPLASTSVQKPSCAACHREHLGWDNDLTKIANDRCQVCHQNRFSSFAAGHPSFGDYPFRERSRIVFDHKKHLQLHFREGAGQTFAPESCLNCHSINSDGGAMLIKPFEQACAACHNKDFAGLDTGAPAIPVLRAPLIDVEGFQDADLPVGEWPDDWDSLETTFPPLSLLLAADTEARRKAAAQLQGKDLDVIDEDDQKAGYEIAWAFKEMLHDVGEKGFPEIERRIRAPLGRQLSAAERADLRTVFSPGMIKTVANRWFPRLKQEIARHREGKSPEAAFMESDDLEERLAIDPVELGGGWTRADASLTLGYRPAAHADPFMKLWLELARAARRSGSTEVDLFGSLAGTSDKVAPGRCMKCHTANTESGNLLHWQGRRPDPARRATARFSHASHFHLLKEKNCVTCHRLDFSGSSEEFLAAFEYYNPDGSKRMVSNFRSINKSACAQCHTRERAGENCLDCHNYHVGDFGGIPPKGALFPSVSPDGNL